MTPGRFRNAPSAGSIAARDIPLHAMRKRVIPARAHSSRFRWSSDFPNSASPPRRCAYINAVSTKPPHLTSPYLVGKSAVQRKHTNEYEPPGQPSGSQSGILLDLIIVNRIDLTLGAVP